MKNVIILVAGWLLYAAVANAAGPKFPVIPAGDPASLNGRPLTGTPTDGQGWCYQTSSSAYIPCTSSREITFGICAGANCAVNDTVSIPRLISSVSAGTLTKCKAKTGTGPTGSALSVQVKKNGTTTATVSVSAGQTLGNTTTFSASTIAEDDILTIVISAIGSPTPGKDVFVVCTVQ